MPENNDINADAVTAAAPPGETGSASSAKGSGLNVMAPVPIFESFIYDFVPPGMGGDGSGRPGSVGGKIGGKDPKFRVLTYPFLPPPVPDIERS